MSSSESHVDARATLDKVMLEQMDDAWLVDVMVATRRFLDRLQEEFARRQGHGLAKSATSPAGSTL